MSHLSSPKITIVHGMPDTNAGGSALGISLIQTLKCHFPEAIISYVSTHSRKNLVKSAYPFIRTFYPDIKLSPYPIEGRSDNYEIKNNFHRKLRNLIWALKTLFSIMYVVFPSFRSNETLKEIKNSNIVLSRGTHMFYESNKDNPILSLISKFWLCFPLLMAWRYRCPFIIYAQSIGPLYYIFTKKLIRFTFNRASVILAREEISANYMKNTINILPQKIIVVPDSVFVLNRPHKKEIEKVSLSYSFPYKKFIVFVIRALKTSRDEMKVFRLFKELANFLYDKEIIEKCVIITQCHHFPDYKGFESDEEISRSLFEYLTRKKECPVELISKAFSHDELLAIYAAARYVISLRLHAALFSLISGTPVLAISVSGFKTEGIMQSLGLAKNVYKEGEVRLNKQEIINRLLEYEKNYDGNVQEILEHIKLARKKAHETPNIVRSFMIWPRNDLKT